MTGALLLLGSIIGSVSSAIGTFFHEIGHDQHALAAKMKATMRLKLEKAQSKLQKSIQDRRRILSLVRKAKGNDPALISQLDEEEKKFANLRFDSLSDLSGQMLELYSPRAGYTNEATTPLRKAASAPAKSTSEGALLPRRVQLGETPNAPAGSAYDELNMGKAAGAPDSPAKV